MWTIITQLYKYNWIYTSNFIHYVKPFILYSKSQLRDYNINYIILNLIQHKINTVKDDFF